MGDAGAPVGIGKDGRPYNLAQYVAYQAARGRGAYGLGKLGRSLGGRIGKAFGSRKAGQLIGGLAGRAAGTMLGTGGFIGSGEYEGDSEAATNSLVAGSNVAVPTMQGGDEIGSVVISHREYLGNVTGSIGFENSTFSINPGLSSSFPFLSQIAANYEEYSFVQLGYTYISLLSSATASGVVGSIIMTTDYNAGDQPYNSTNEMLNNIGTISARPTDGPVVHMVECDPSKNVQGSGFVRIGSIPAKEDIKTYDMGIFQLATEGMPVNDQIQGQLWVSYQCVLRKPKLATAVGKTILMDCFKIFRIGATLSEGKAVQSPYNSLGITLKIGSLGTGQPYIDLIWPATVVQGTYRVELSMLNPQKDDNYPQGGDMTPSLTFSNMTGATPQIYAQSCENPFFYQQVQYNNTQPLGSDPQFSCWTICKLKGSYAIPTYLRFSWSSLGANFTADAMQINIIQSNPTIEADTRDSPPYEWVPANVYG